MVFITCIATTMSVPSNTTSTILTSPNTTYSPSMILTSMNSTFETFPLLDIFSAPVLLVAAATTAAIAVLGTLGNLLSVVALLRSVKLRRPSTYYIVNLAVSNLPVCILAMPLLSIVCVQALILNKVTVPRPVLHGIAAMGFISNQAELHTICVLSFNRVLAMFKPRLYQRLVQLRAYRWVLIVMWLYSVAMWLPLICGWLGELEVSEKNLFVIISKKSKLMRRIFLFFAFTLPLLFSLICHVFLFCKGMHMGPDSTSQQQWRHHVTKTITWVFLLLLVLSVPHIVIHALHERGYSIPKTWLLVHVLFFGRYVLDPAIFVLSSSEYRQAFAETLVYLMPCFASPLGASVTSEGVLAPPCTPAAAPRHKVIDLSALDLTKLKVASKEVKKMNNTEIKMRFS